MENIFWDVEFDGTAKKDGRLTVSITFGTDIVPPGTRSVAVFVQVRAGMSPEAKAQATVNALKAALGADFFEFEFSPPDDDFKLRIKTPGPNERYIREMWVRDSGTGEDIEAVRDDPGREELLLVGFFSIDGKGRDKAGVARLQIGKKLPLINIKTYGKTGTAITREIMRAFNRRYKKFGFAAREMAGVPGIAIENVPCPLGIRAGTTDTGLVTERGLLQGSSEIPATRERKRTKRR
jgi:hypothetical protein